LKPLTLIAVPSNYLILERGVTTTQPVATSAAGSKKLETAARTAESLRAKALYTYTASTDDPNEVSFVKDEILEITDNTGKWWRAKKTDGTTGIVPSNHMLLIGSRENMTLESTQPMDSVAKSETIQTTNPTATHAEDLESVRSIGSATTQTAEAWHAKALYTYTASADDPNEISFTKGEIMKITDIKGKWWFAKKADGTTGIAPSNYLQNLGRYLDSAIETTMPLRARAICDYSVSYASDGELPLCKDEVLDIIDKTGPWWKARKPDGTVGLVPRSFIMLDKGKTT